MTTFAGVCKPSREADAVISAGRWLFRYRALLAAVVAVGSWWAAAPLSLWSGLGAAMVILCLVVRLWAIIHMGPQAHSAEPTVSKLIYTGPYELTRNPIYISNIVGLSGLGMTAAGPTGWALAAAVSIAAFNAMVRYEEDFLEKRLGEIYRSYRNRVPRWMGEAAPVHAAAPKGILAERIKAAFRAERSTMVGAIIVTLMVLIRAASLG